MRSDRIWRLAAALAAAFPILASCAGDSDMSRPLPPLAVRERLIGRTVMGSDEEGRQFYLHFAPSGVALRNAQTAEYGWWAIDDAGRLCLRWHDGAPQCAPVYQVHIGRYRFGDTVVDVSGRAGDPFARFPFR
ncbi:MAG: hypothetical protein JO010_05020 [Alphaproteobacteria bacterium]|nr:hypothetical protein [Alphaproteobacteria bacterium]